MLLSENRQCISTKDVAAPCEIDAFGDFARLSRLYPKVESGSFARRSVPRRFEAVLRHPRFIYVGERVS
jgi:hypothetical protein